MSHLQTGMFAFAPACFNKKVPTRASVHRGQRHRHERGGQSQIFDPFFTTKDVGEGTGLGLSIVKGILDDHRATLDIHSSPGQGSTFLITFPS